MKSNIIKKALSVILTLALTLPMLAPNAIGGMEVYDISEYRLESKYFIWDSPTYLVGNITPENFSKYLDYMDNAYELYVELVGQLPFFKGKITIFVDSLDGVHFEKFTAKDVAACAYIDRFVFNEDYIGSYLYYYNYLQNTQNFYLNGLTTLEQVSIHELAHVFSFNNNFTFTIEFFAEFILEYVNYKTGRPYSYATEAFYENKFKEVMGNPEFTMPLIINNYTDLFVVFYPILREIGWEPFKSAYRSYDDPSYVPEINYLGSDYKGDGKILKFYDFLDRLTYFSGVNVRDLVSADFWVEFNKVWSISIIVDDKIPIYSDQRDKYPDLYIELNIERLYSGSFNIVSYSTDGKKWKNGQPDVLGLLNKQLQLSVKDSDGNIASFPTIEARPKANADKLVINYAICADPTGMTPGAWTLSKRGGTVAMNSGIQITPVLSDSQWLELGDGGIPVLPYGSTKQSYLARTAPIVEDGRIVPASKTFKLMPAVQGKSVNIKADYKKEIIKLKTGLNIFGGTLEQLNGNVPVATASSVFDTGLRYTAQTADSRTGIPLTAILDRTDKTSNTTQTICIWTPATATKPATKVQEYKLAMRGVVAPQTINGTNGTVRLPNTLEVYDTTKNRWGTLPRFTESKMLENAIRLKTTARATGTDDSAQTAASMAVTLTIDYGVYTPPDARTAKRGVLSVAIGDATLPEEVEEAS